MSARVSSGGCRYVSDALLVAVLACSVLVLLVEPAVSQRTAETNSFDCVIDPARVVKLGSPVTGILGDVVVNRGDIVNQGDVVATMDLDLEKVAVEISRVRAASMAEFDAQVARNNLIRKELERTEELVRKNVSTSQKLDELTAQLEVGLRELDRLQLQRHLARLDFEKSEKLLNQRVLRSPIDGVVQQRVLTGGEFVNQQSHVLVIAQLDPLLVETFLPVEYYSKIKIGRPGKVTTDGAVAGTFEANVTVIDRVFDAASKTFGVRLELPNPGYVLPAGQVCTVSF